MDFKEEQKYRSLWIYLILAISTGVLLWLTRSGYVIELVHLLLIFTPILAIIFLVEYSKLYTTISKEGITFKFKPYQKSWTLIPWSKIKNIETKKYNPIRDYGGWGMRKSKLGKGYNTRGNIGIFISTSDNETIMIGTQKEDEVKKVVQHFYHKTK